MVSPLIKSNAFNGFFASFSWASNQAEKRRTGTSVGQRFQPRKKILHPLSLINFALSLDCRCAGEGYILQIPDLRLDMDIPS